MLQIYLLLILALLLSFSLIIFLLRMPFLAKVLDQPNVRSLHMFPTPRFGGVAIIVAILVSWSLAGIANWPIYACVTVLAILSLLDDVKGLNVGWRFLGHTLTALAFLLLLPLPLHILFLLPVILAMVWMINLYNFMDGSDGLAGGMAVFGFGAYAIAAYLAGDNTLMLQSAVVAAASLGFLWFNFHPARIFMGDVGSVPLGFLAVALGLLGLQQGDWPLWFPLLVFSPFIVDATVTLLKRLLRREKIWQAHRSHYYQRLVQMGWGHRKTAIAEYVLMLAAGGSAVLLLHQSILMVLFILILWVLVYAVIMWLIDRFWAAHIRN